MLAAIGNKLIKVGNKIGLYPSCCCGEPPCDCICDPCVTITVSIGGATATGNCTSDQPGFISGWADFEGGGISFTASCSDGDWNIGYSVCYIGDQCVATGGGYSIWECDSQSIVDEYWDESSFPEGCRSFGPPSVQVSLGGNCGSSSSSS
jgi:hypothetical protein